MTSTITIPVDAGTARAFSSAPPEVVRDIQQYAQLKMRETTERLEKQRQAKDELSRIMDRIGEHAERQGLTDEIFEELMRDES